MADNTIRLQKYLSECGVASRRKAEELIAAEDCGWVVPNDSNAYAALLTRLRDNPEEIQRKMRNTVAIAPNHTWESRAQQVAKELTNLK